MLVIMGPPGVTVVLFLIGTGLSKETLRRIGSGRSRSEFPCG
jgi:hypothetical protein